MARWTPQSNQPIGSSERVGRRLFEEPSLAGAKDQKPLGRLDLRHFQDKRGKVSLDRLGRSNVEKAVLRYLEPRAHRAGTKLQPPKPFHGWAVLAARNFGSPPAPKGYALSVVPSPIISVVPLPNSREDLDENIYHAHIPNPQNLDHYLLALHLRELFENHGTVEPIAKLTEPIRTDNGFLRLLPTWFRKLLPRRFK